MAGFFINVQDGKMINKQEVAVQFQNLKDGQHYCELSSFKVRTLSMNAYWWGVLVPIARRGLYNIGYNEIKTDEDAHEALKKLFLKGMPNILKPTSKKLSTATLTTVQFSQVINEVIIWAVTYLYEQIPYPNEPCIILAEYDPELQVTIVSK